MANTRAQILCSLSLSFLTLLGCRHEEERARIAQSTVITSTVATPPPPASSDVDTTTHAPIAYDIADLVHTRRYEMAWELVSEDPPAWLRDTSHLLRGYLATHTARPRLALEHLQLVDDAPRPLQTWVDQMRITALAQTPDYVTHLTELAKLGSFDALVATAERLLKDDLLQSADRLLVACQRSARDEMQQGDLRWLRARLRHAQDKPQLAHGDVRWLVVSHPDHRYAGAALQAIVDGWFPSLLPREQLARAQSAAERGLPEVVRSSFTGLGDSKLISEGEQRYLLGLALYRARRYAEALEPLDDAVKLGAARGGHARFLAAVAASRSGAPADALKRMSLIAASAPVTETVEQASFHLGRQAALLGEWQRASEYYGAFLSAFPTSPLAEPAHRERLLAWFAEGNDRRFIYWVRQFLSRFPDARERLLLRCLEAYSLRRLGHAELANTVWKDVARTAPISLAGFIARARLAESGVVSKLALNTTGESSLPNLPLPNLVSELDRAGLSEQAERALRAFETPLLRQQTSHGEATLCDAYGQIESGRRRYELGRESGPRHGTSEAPQLTPTWVWRCLYPTPYGRSLAQHTRQHGVDPALTYAVMRQESGFSARIESPAGARGLMQLIEPTARKIAEELGVDYQTDLLDFPHYNIEFGVFYLKKLQGHFHHPALVAAAYNAGPDAAARWFAAGRSLPLEWFVARVPYDETRSYVQRVLENWIMYSLLLNGQEPTLPLRFDEASGPAPNLEMSHRAPDGFY